MTRRGACTRDPCLGHVRPRRAPPTQTIYVMGMALDQHLPDRVLARVLGQGARRILDRLQHVEPGRAAGRDDRGQQAERQAGDQHHRRSGGKLNPMSASARSIENTSPTPRTGRGTARTGSRSPRTTTDAHPAGIPWTRSSTMPTTRSRPSSRRRSRIESESVLTMPIRWMITLIPSRPLIASMTKSKTLPTILPMALPASTVDVGAGVGAGVDRVLGPVLIPLGVDMTVGAASATRPRPSPSSTPDQGIRTGPRTRSTPAPTPAPTSPSKRATPSARSSAASSTSSSTRSTACSG